MFDSFLADKQPPIAALEVIPGSRSSEREAVSLSPPRGAQSGGLQPVVVAPGRAVVPDPAPLTDGVRGPQPAAARAIASKSDGPNHEFLSLRGHASEVSRVSLTGGFGLVIGFFISSSLVTEPAVEGGRPASLAVTRPVGRLVELTGLGLLTEEVPDCPTVSTIPVPTRCKSNTVPLLF